MARQKVVVEHHNCQNDSSQETSIPSPLRQQISDLVPLMRFTISSCSQIWADCRQSGPVGGSWRHRCIAFRRVCVVGFQEQQIRCCHNSSKRTAPEDPNERFSKTIRFAKVDSNLSVERKLLTGSTRLAYQLRFSLWPKHSGPVRSVVPSHLLRQTSIR